MASKTPVSMPQLPARAGQARTGKAKDESRGPRQYSSPRLIEEDHSLGRHNCMAYFAKSFQSTDWMEAALRHSEGRLLCIVGSAKDAIVTMAEDERIVFFNAGAERVFRCAAAKAIGQPFGPFLTERSRAALSSYIQAFGQPGPTQWHMSRAALSAFRADGKEYPVESTI
jgi:PAS domain S-box-containing protein